ncbi:glycosyltransferase family 4 protein [Halorubrum laminariae]|uniref:Glycosyltransferase family 4 protein n=1 Tax=Halorubrum laminariae TaxID=1433523 RepID=A0ABD6C200_9EURY|nr:glycosyltransferase family 4 protein [Halorubrum laminariae]
MSDRPLKILRVASSIYPEVVGGVGLHTHHMSRLQAEQGHEVTVLTTNNGDRSLPRRESRNGYTLIRHRELFRPLDNSIVPGIARTLRRKIVNFDIIHLHSHLYFTSNIGALLSKWADKPVVVTNHGLVSQTAPGWIQSIFNSTLGKFTFEAADVVLCYTDTDRKRLEKKNIGTDLEVIHNGIDCTRFTPNNGTSKKQILFVGRLKPGKGVDDLVQSFGELSEDYPGWELHIVGDGPLLPDLKEEAEQLGVSSSVTFHGEVPNERLPHLYQTASIFTLPSYSEGLPRTVLEAMACGTPVVTSELEQLQALVKDAGLTAPAGEPQKLASALANLVENPRMRREFGSIGRERVEENYSWEDTVRQTTEVYKELLA